MGQAKTRGSRDDRVQQALARRMDTANRRMEQQARLAERFELVKRVMDGDTSVQLPQGVLDRLKPLGLSVVGVGYDGTTQDVSPAGASFSPHAAADAYLTREQLAERYPPRDHDVIALNATLDRMDVPARGGRCTCWTPTARCASSQLHDRHRPGQPGRRSHRVSGTRTCSCPCRTRSTRTSRPRCASWWSASREASARAPSPK
jgi:hypothetical protein